MLGYIAGKVFIPLIFTRMHVVCTYFDQVNLGCTYYYYFFEGETMYCYRLFLAQGGLYG